MNWTGGSLQRHSKNAHKGVVSRQKQHFAKIRTALQNGSGAAAVPFRPSYLVEDNETLCSQLTPFGRGSVRHTGHSKRLSERRESEGLCLWESQPRKPRDEARQPAEVAAFRGRYQSHPLPHRSGSYGPESTPGDAGGVFWHRPLTPHKPRF